MKALTIDKTDHNIWFHIGKVAYTIGEYNVARFALETTLSSGGVHHHMAATILMEIMYIISDVQHAVQWAEYILKREPSCDKAKAILYMIRPSIEIEDFNPQCLKLLQNLHDRIAALQVNRMFVTERKACIVLLTPYNQNHLHLSVTSCIIDKKLCTSYLSGLLLCTNIEWKLVFHQTGW